MTFIEKYLAKFLNALSDQNSRSRARRAVAHTHDFDVPSFSKHKINFQL